MNYNIEFKLKNNKIKRLPIEIPSEISILSRNNCTECRIDFSLTDTRLADEVFIFLLEEPLENISQYSLLLDNIILFEKPFSQATYMITKLQSNLQYIKSLIII